MEVNHKDEKQLLLRLKEHFEQAFSQLNRLIEAYLILKSSKQQVPKPIQLIQHLKTHLSPFKGENSQPFFCGKEFEPSKNSRKIYAYTCQECRQEFNSTVCEECFDVQKHEGHNYKRIQLESGSCDCGCRSKWSDQGFCQVHKYNHERIQQLVEKQEFRGKLSYFCKILYIISSFTKQLKVQQQKMLKRVDELCASFIYQLNELARRNKAVNMTISSLLSQKISIVHSGQVQIWEILLSFTKLQKTAEKCVQFFNTLFVLNESLQTEISSIYLNRHNEFLFNAYSNLKHIIFANGLQGEDNWLSGKVFDLAKTSKDQSFVQQVKQAYKDQYLKINIINNLHRESSIILWTNFYHNGKFNCVGDYCKFLTTEEHHMQLNQSHYDIEQLFMGQMIRAIDIIRQEDFFPKICADLFQKITKATQQPPIANNLLFTYERLWTACTYALIVQKNGNFEASFEIFLLKILRLESNESSLNKFCVLFEKILKYMQTSNIRPVAHLKQHTSFVNVYYNNCGYFDRNGVLLASIDAIFFKIVVRMIIYISPKDSIINNKINQFIQIVYTKALKNLNQISMKNRILCLTNFIEKLHECLFSQYSDLFLATKFQAFRTKEYYLEKHKSYLQNMLASLHVEAIDAKTFDQLFKHFFFDAPEAFLSFKKQMAKQQSFFPANAKGRTINILFLASLVGKRSLHTQKYYIQDKIPFQVSTYPDSKHNQSLPQILLKSQAFQNLKVIFKQTVERIMSLQMKIAFRTMRYLAAYPDVKTSQKNSIQQFIEQQEIFLFKTKQYKGKEETIQSGFIVDKYPQKEVECDKNQLEQFLKQSQDQNDQNLKQQKNSINYDNNSPSQVGRIQQKQIYQTLQSGKSSKESASANQITAQFKPRCSKLKCDHIIEKMVLPCYVSFKRAPSMFDILPDQKCLIFTSCQHFFHQQNDCLPKIQNSGFGSCPICSRKFNFLLMLPDTYNETNEQKDNRIISMIDNQIKNLELHNEKQQKEHSEKQQKKNKEQQLKRYNEKQQKKQWYFRALKSIVLFFLMISMTAKTKESDFHVYKTLAKILRLYFSFNQNFKEKDKIISKMLQTEKNSKNQDLIKYLTCVVGQIILPSIREYLFEERESLSLCLSNKQSLVIKQAISQCLGLSTTLPIKSFIQPQKIRLFELPDNLELLTRKYTGICQQCKGPKKISFVICLHPHHQSKDIQEKVCISCIDLFISQHIRIIQKAQRTEKYVKHEEQMLTITSDTGNITYFAKFDKKIWAIQLGSVYQDDNLNNLTLCQAINADKIPSRSTFTLKKEKYEQIVLNFYMRKYLGSSDMEIFLEQMPMPKMASKQS